jgi:L-amino acid N-acyltransferase YncA
MIRIAKFEDLESITGIYNQAIDAKFQTAFTERVTVADRAEWFQQHPASSFPLFVYEMGDKVVGWVSISPYRAGRPALRRTVEISYFVHTSYLKKGIGSQLLQHALNACTLLHYKTIIAIILDKNTASMKLLEKFGFERWAYLPDVADFDGVICSHIYYGKSLT